MGRYIEGDISHKLWVAVQPSDAPEQFGAIEEETSIIHYVLCKSNFDVDRLNELINEINNYLKGASIVNLTTNPDSLYELYDLVHYNKDYSLNSTKQLELLFADTILGLKIYQRLLLEDDDSCIYFTSEI